MSANDEILIIKKSRKYYAYHNCCVDNDFDFEEHKPFAEATSKKEIEKKVDEYIGDDLSPEYGVNWV